MSEKERVLVEELALKQATYSIDAIDCPNMIILRDELRNLIDIIYRLQRENEKLKKVYKDAKCTLGQNYRLKQELTKYKEINEKAIEHNKQIIKDTKSFYRPTADTIYSGDCLIDIAEQNILILEDKENKSDK